MDMESINRSAIVVKIKQPFIDWLKQLPDADDVLPTLDEDGTVYLIPAFDTPEQVERYIRKNAGDIIDQELFGWCTEESWWPKQRTHKMLQEWFSVEFHSIILDMEADKELNHDPD